MLGFIGIVFGSTSHHATRSVKVDGIAGTAVRLGFGPLGGLRVRLTPTLVALLEGHWLYLPAQDPLGEWYTSAVVRWGVSRNHALSLEGRYGPPGGEGHLSLMTYF